MRALPGLLLLTAAMGGVATAAELRFGPDLTASGWTAVTYPGIRPAIFGSRDPATLEIATDASAGMLWRPTDHASLGARRARWRWRADEGVGPTDLSRRGADDRILGAYFIFGSGRDQSLAPIRMLASSSVTALVYVFGGNRPRGTIVPSPHMRERGKFWVLRAADAAKRTWHEESVDVAADYLRAFGRTAPLLIGFAVSSDSDDTRGRNRASIANVNIEP